MQDAKDCGAAKCYSHLNKIEVRLLGSYCQAILWNPELVELWEFPQEKIRMTKPTVISLSGGDVFILFHYD